MSTITTSQEFESFIPVNDVVPEKWDDARVFLIEMLKKISNAVNVREIGWLLDEELLSGKAFVPGVISPGNNPGVFRQVFRKVIDVSPLVIGANVFLHGITFDVNFTLVDLWVAATNSVGFLAQVITNNDVTLNATQILINSPAAYNRAWCVIEYLLEQ